MEDKAIIGLYWARSQEAIRETERKYGPYCRKIAKNILYNDEDTKECVSDTWLKAWNTIPPQRPNRLAVYLGTITRNLALDRWRTGTADKRGGGQVPLALEELGDCLAGKDSEEAWIEDFVLSDLLNRFLGRLNRENRVIFLKRYWYLCPVKDIAQSLGLTESKVKMSLHRSRQRLRAELEKEGISL